MAWKEVLVMEERISFVLLTPDQIAAGQVRAKELAKQMKR